MAKSAKKTLLFLCTGNYFRSRFAEVLFNSVANRMGLPWQAISSGLALERGINVGPMAKGAVKTLETMGVKDPGACNRMPRPATEAEMAAADRIIALQQTEHEPLMKERFPAFADKVEYWDARDVPDVLPLIEKEVMGLVATLLGGKADAPPPPQAPPTKEAPKKKLTARVGRETAGRRGKGVTTIFDLPLNEDGLKELAQTLKQRCGTGGTVKDGRIEIQGDNRERVIVELEKLGYSVKRVGG